MHYRKEYKFLVSNADLEILRNRLQHLIKQDPHQTNPDGYLITSLYFDDIFDSCWNENIQGYDYRHKYRLRLYDHDTDVIHLERKSKIHGLTAKTAASVSKEECLLLMQGKIPMICASDPPEKKTLLAQMKAKGMRPKCIVQYNREAFVYPAGNVRITFDQNIGGTNKVQTLLDKHILTAPLLDEGIHVLEVKYDDILPRFISEALELGNLQRCAISKYAYTRNFIAGVIRKDTLL